MDKDLFSDYLNIFKHIAQEIDNKGYWETSTGKRYTDIFDVINDSKNRILSKVEKDEE